LSVVIGICVNIYLYPIIHLSFLVDLAWTTEFTPVSGVTFFPFIHTLCQFHIFLATWTPYAVRSTFSQQRAKKVHKTIAIPFRCLPENCYRVSTVTHFRVTFFHTR
jgi:hypothetical protein